MTLREPLKLLVDGLIIQGFDTENDTGYSLWLAPASSGAVFTDLILSLSRCCTPPTIPFPPHVTLLSSSQIPRQLSLEEILQRIQQIVTHLRIDCINCRFDKLEAGQSFFQCVYIKLLKEESEGLLDLCRALSSVFGETKRDTDGRNSYFPHVSLVYGDLSMNVKHDLIKDMQKKGESLIVEGNAASVAGYMHFDAKEILVVRTIGRPDEWEVMGRVPFGRSIAHEDL